MCDANVRRKSVSQKCLLQMGDANACDAIVSCICAMQLCDAIVSCNVRRNCVARMYRQTHLRDTIASHTRLCPPNVSLDTLCRAHVRRNCATQLCRANVKRTCATPMCLTYVPRVSHTFNTGGGHVAPPRSPRRQSRRAPAHNAPARNFRADAAQSRRRAPPAGCDAGRAAGRCCGGGEKIGDS